MSAPGDLERLSRPLARLLRVPEEQLPGCLVAASEADLEALLALRRQILGDELQWDDRAYLRWRYVLDGARLPALHTGAPCGRMWLLKRDDAVLGCLGADRVTFAHQGQLIPALRFMDIMVVPRMNGLGIGAWLTLMLLKETEVGIVVGGNDQSLSMIARLFHRMPDRRTWSLPLRTRPLLALRSPRIAGIPGVSAVLDLGLAMRRGVRRRVGRVPVEVSDLADAIPAIDALDDTMVNAGLTFVTRSEAAWRWRFLRNPRRSYRLHQARHHGKTVAVVASKDGGEVGELVDWVWDASQPQAVTSGILMTLFSEVIDGFLERGASRARAMTYDAFSDDIFRRLGMVRRASQAGYSVRARPSEREARLIDDPRWFVTMGDSDGD